MILRIFKGVWFVSLLVVMASLLWVYAGLPEQVIVQEDAGGRVEANREFVFYVLTFGILIINVLVYIVKKLYINDIDLRTWFHGLIITINIFLVLGMNVIQTYNSGENFDFSRIGFVLYASVVLIVGWAVSWPIYALFRKSSAKQAIF
jgi:hypothetical protein